METQINDYHTSWIIMTMHSRTYSIAHAYTYRAINRLRHAYRMLIGSQTNCFDTNAVPHPHPPPLSYHLV